MDLTSTTIMEVFSTIMENKSTIMDIYGSHDIGFSTSMKKQSKIVEIQSINMDIMNHNYGKPVHSYGHYRP